MALGDPVLENLEEAARKDGRSLSNAVFHQLVVQVTTAPERVKGNGDGYIQLTLPFGSEPEKGDGLGVTFRDSKRLPVHGWYPYVEGFSAQYVTDSLFRFNSPKSVYDPFGGAGTTQVAASHAGVPSFYSEINPLMRFIADAKVNSASWASANIDIWRSLANDFVSVLLQNTIEERAEAVTLEDYHTAFPNRDYFDESHLRTLLATINLAKEVAALHPHALRLLLLSCAANTVKSSHMTRRADLRRRRPDEYKNRVVDVPRFIASSVNQITQDVEALPTHLKPTVCVSEDARRLPFDLECAFDFAITSPPYLNGTNYFRNTKLELWLLGLIASEADLAVFRRNAICAGINNVRADRETPATFPFVEELVRSLHDVAYDQRIPKMIRHYCSDMRDVFNETFRALRPGGHFVMDIGDSCFCGVHVPTHSLLQTIAAQVGFDCIAENELAKRYSKGPVQLKQVEMVLRKPGLPKSGSMPLQTSLRLQIADFRANLPYKTPPYTKRNWGHPLHSLCSYQGKLKPSIAHWLVNDFVPEGGSVLDPLGGVGTIAFEACVSGRFAVSVDKSPFAATVAAAKLNPPTLEAAITRIDTLEQELKAVELTDADFAEADFGLNATVKDYYHPDTLVEVLKARKLFLTSRKKTPAMTFVWASLLHILHGNRPYALSRTSHPITPFNPSGDFEYRGVIERLHKRVRSVLSDGLPDSFRRGIAENKDFRDFLSKTRRRFDTVVTSPPFHGMRFDRPNWLRLWFCGWNEQSFHETSQTFLEREQVRSMDCYNDFFSGVYQVLQSNGLLIIHVGDSNGMPEQLAARAKTKFSLIDEVTEDVTDVEKHGLTDKSNNRTKAHHFLFFRKL